MLLDNMLVAVLFNPYSVERRRPETSSEVLLAVSVAAAELVVAGSRTRCSIGMPVAPTMCNNDGWQLVDASKRDRQSGIRSS
jgi:hypothetical protein